jgi:hypothetical protein
MGSGQDNNLAGSICDIVYYPLLKTRLCHEKNQPQSVDSLCGYYFLINYHKSGEMPAFILLAPWIFTTFSVRWFFLLNLQFCNWRFFLLMPYFRLNIVGLNSPSRQITGFMMFPTRIIKIVCQTIPSLAIFRLSKKSWGE